MSPLGQRSDDAQLLAREPARHSGGAQEEDQHACFVWSPQTLRTSRQADITLQQPPAINLDSRSEAVTVVGCVLDGKHSRPVPVYPTGMHLVLDAGVRAGGNLEGYGKQRNICQIHVPVLYQVVKPGGSTTVLTMVRSCVPASFKFSGRAVAPDDGWRFSRCSCCV